MAAILGTTLSKLGRKNVIVWGTAVDSFASIMCGVAALFGNVWAFYIITTFARLL